MKAICTLAAGVFVHLCFAATAWASVPTTYDVTKCLGSEQTLNGATSLKRVSGTNGSITNISSGPITIYCPITKFTSGPGISNDALIDANFPVTIPSGSPPGTFMSCGLEVYQSQFYSDGTNFVESQWSGDSTVGTSTMDIPGVNGPEGFWDGIGLGWYYADLSCILPAGTSIGNYTITENGSLQSNRIFTTSSCAPDSTDTDFWRVLDSDSGDDPIGGCLQSSAQDGTKFVFDCPVPSSSSVEFTLGPAEGSGTFGCSLDHSVAPQTWPTQTVVSNAGVVQVIPLAGSGQTLVRVPAGGSHKLVCDQQPDASDGDPRIHSYRTEPDWVPTASNSAQGDPPTNATDQNSGSRWGSGTKQVPGMWFKVDMQSAKSFSKIKMDATGSNNDYPRGYQVYVSNDNANWGNPIASGTGTGPVVTVPFTTQTARFIKVVQTGTLPAGQTYWWSMYEFTVYK
jgi:hypothetical protein